MLEAEDKVNLLLFKGGEEGEKQDQRGWGAGALSVEGEQREKHPCPLSSLRICPVGSQRL